MITNILENVLYGAVTGFILAITYIGFSQLIQYYKSNIATNIANTVNKINEIYTILNDLVVLTPAKRVVILKAHNGGNIPKVGTPMYSTAMYSISVPPLEPIRHRWSKAVLDEQYIDLINELLQKGDVVVRTATMLPGILKDIYEAEHFVQSCVYPIKIKKDEFYYLSIAFTETIDMTPSYKSIVRTSLDRLKQIV